MSKNTGDTDAWTQLPHVTPGHIVGARKIRRFLTGTLSAPVASYPGVSGYPTHGPSPAQHPTNLSLVGRRMQCVDPR